MIYPKMNSLADEYLKEGKIVKKKITIAPSWGKKNILNYNIQKLLKNFFIMVIQLTFVLITKC